MRIVKLICCYLKASSVNGISPLSVPLALLFALSGTAQSAVITYTDEAAYLTALAGLSFVSTAPESFEDGAWVDARTVPQPSVTNQGITWSRLNASFRTSTGGSNVHDGSYIMFTFDNRTGLHAIPDGYTLAANGFSLYGVGGWFRAGTVANLDFIVDGDPFRVGFTGTETTVSSSWKFLGFIENDPGLGFGNVKILETDETGNETRFFFSDDFTLAGQAGAFPPAAVPLPASLPLFGTGLMAVMGFLGRRSRRT